MNMGSPSTRSTRIEVHVPLGAGAKHERELLAFARYCIQRIEGEIGERQHWMVEVDIKLRRFIARIAVQHQGLTIEARGDGHDGPLAIWDAMCRVEQMLRERRAVPRIAIEPAND
jgi:hypothetical protein